MKYKAICFYECDRHLVEERLVLEPPIHDANYFDASTSPQAKHLIVFRIHQADALLIGRKGQVVEFMPRIKAVYATDYGFVVQYVMEVCKRCRRHSLCNVIFGSFAMADRYEVSAGIGPYQPIMQEEGEAAT